ncbi:MAG: YbhB/YbcL family Raf kinase inhibitor-like protein [Clostridia bacterium]|nr:YbhB/YbcL family Raf kinase inhibitor-like protein [Clostridia bacterium]
MKKYIGLICLTLSFIICLCACSTKSDEKTSTTTSKNIENIISSTQTTKEQDLKITSSAITNGKIEDEYGKRGSQISNSIPTRSIPLSVTSKPQGTVCYAITMTDPDSKPLCGYEWIHWLACNIIPDDISANASIDMKDSIIQGKNSFGTIGYGGPTPPDKTHKYVITIYALDAELELSNGYSLDSFQKATQDHILDTMVIYGSYDN